MSQLNTQDIALLLQNMAEHSLDADSKLIALIRLLDKKGLIKKEEFDQEYGQVLQYMKQQAQRMRDK